jgi:hypothetical protein
LEVYPKVLIFKPKTLALHIGDNTAKKQKPPKPNPAKHPKKTNNHSSAPNNTDKHKQNKHLQPNQHNSNHGKPIQHNTQPRNHIPNISQTRKTRAHQKNQQKNYTLTEKGTQTITLFKENNPIKKIINEL